MFMSSGAMPSTVKGRGMAKWFIITWTPVTPSPPATFTSTQRYALEMRRWPVLIKTQDVHAAREALRNRKDRSITEAFERVAKLKVTYSHHQHTTTESWCVFIPQCSMTELTMNNRAEIVHWVAESKCPFQIINDHRFQSLMKTGRPDYHIPSMQTISCDVKCVFIQVRKCIAKMLQVR